MTSEEFEFQLGERYANERTDKRTSDGPSESAGGDNGGLEGFSEPLFQIEVCGSGELLGCVPQCAIEEWLGGDSVPDDRSHRGLSGDDLAAFLGAVDAG